MEDLTALERAAANFTTIPDFEGKGAEAIKSYIAEVHGMLIAGMLAAMRSYLTQFCAYKKAMFAQDSDEGAEFREDYISDLQGAYGSDEGKFMRYDQRLASILDQVNDLVTYRGPTNSDAIESAYRAIWQGAGRVRTVIGETDVARRGDLADVQAMISQLNALLDQAEGGSISVTRFRVGTMGNSTAGAQFLELLGYMEIANAATDPALETTLEEDFKKYHDPASTRIITGAFKVSAGIGLHLVGIGAIAGSAGSATPIVAGGFQALIGLAQTIEGGQDIGHGLHENSWSSSFNYIRDPLGIDPTIYDFATGAAAIGDGVVLYKLGGNLDNYILRVDTKGGYKAVLQPRASTVCISGTASGPGKGWVMSPTGSVINGRYLYCPCIGANGSRHDGSPGRPFDSRSRTGPDDRPCARNRRLQCLHKQVCRPKGSAANCS